MYMRVFLTLPFHLWISKCRVHHIFLAWVCLIIFLYIVDWCGFTLKKIHNRYKNFGVTLFEIWNCVLKEFFFFFFVLCYRIVIFYVCVKCVLKNFLRFTWNCICTLNWWNKCLRTFQKCLFVSCWPFCKGRIPHFKILVYEIC
jgi:hypothetical protein